MPPPLDMVRLRSFVERGVSQLVAFQCDDGSFAYWPGGASHPWATALALEGLAAAAEAGYRVDARLLLGARQGARHLVDEGRCTPAARVALGQALVAAGERDAALLNALFRERAGLDAAGLARLVIIAAASERPVLARSLFAALMQQSQAGGVMPFRGGRREAWCKDDLQATALALRACQVTGADLADHDAAGHRGAQGHPGPQGKHPRRGSGAARARWRHQRGGGAPGRRTHRGSGRWRGGGLGPPRAGARAAGPRRAGREARGRRSPGDGDSRGRRDHLVPADPPQRPGLRCRGVRGEPLRSAAPGDPLSGSGLQEAGLRAGVLDHRRGESPPPEGPAFAAADGDRLEGHRGAGGRGA